MAEQPHRPVLLEEVVEAMNIREDGYYLDATAGRGGHVAAVLEQLGPSGRILAIDRDPQAVAAVTSDFLMTPEFRSGRQISHHWQVLLSRVSVSTESCLTLVFPRRSLMMHLVALVSCRMARLICA